MRSIGKNSLSQEASQRGDRNISEQSMWSRVRKALKGLDPIRIENRCEKGTPDVNISSGAWIELKIATAPKKEGVLWIEHYTQHQRVWAIRRNSAGGKVFLLLKISNLWVLLKGEVAAKYLGYTTINQLKEKAEKIWHPKLIDQELREILTKN